MRASSAAIIPATDSVDEGAWGGLPVRTFAANLRSQWEGDSKDAAPLLLLCGGKSRTR